MSFMGMEGPVEALLASYDEEGAVTYRLRTPAPYHIGEWYEVILATGEGRSHGDRHYRMVRDGRIVFIGRCFVVVDFGVYRESYFFEEFEERSIRLHDDSIDC